MGKDLREQIHEDFRSSPYTALAIDESTDMTSEAQLLVYGKFACGCHTVEQLLCCLTLHSTATGHDIFSAVDTFFTENQFDWGRVVECCINIAPSMMGRNIGFRGILQRKFPHIHVKYCIIHQEALASNEFSSVFNEVMQVVIKVVNFVKSRDLNCRLFKELCSTENSEHRTLLPRSIPGYEILVLSCQRLPYLPSHARSCLLELELLVAQWGASSCL